MQIKINKLKNILFVTPNSFSQTDGGSILFGELFKSLGEKTISWYICSKSYKRTTLNYKFKSISYSKTSFFDIPFFVSVARHFIIFGIPFFILKYKITSSLCSKKGIHFAKKEKINFIWIYAYDFAIPVAKRMIVKLKIPFHLSIQDDIHTHLARYESKLLENDFKYLIENASTIDFTSKGMCQYYKEKYNISAKTITFMISQQIASAKPELSDEITKIGYAGNIWCKENFQVLLKALEELDNQYSILIKLYVYSNSFPKSYYSKFKKYIVLFPFVEYEKLILQLQNCDLLYLPMSFLQKKAITNITSFPSKILTYMNSQIPILNHSPIDAVSHNFVTENEIGYSINSPKKQVIIDFFIDSNNSLSISQRNLYSENAINVLEKFNTKRMTDNFIALIEDEC